jgi:methyl-accepting chemotaxis protein
MTAILSNLSIRMRMLLSVALFLATLALSMYSAYTSIGANVVFAEQEKKGDYFQIPLSELLHYAGKLRLKIAVARAGQKDEAAIQGLLASIDKSMETLGEAQEKAGDDLQFTDDVLKKLGRENLKYETVLGKWKEIAQKVKANPAGDYDEALASYIADIRGMIGHSGDKSNLILDPDLDSYYLMDVTLLALPQTLDRLSVIGSTFYPRLAAGELTQEQRTQAAVMARMLSESDVDRLSVDMDTSLKEDANFYGTSQSYQENGPKLFAAYAAKSRDLAAMLGKIAAGDSVKVGVFASAINEAQDTASDFLMKGFDELDRLLDFRIQAYRDQQMHSLIASFLGILISVLCFFLVVRTITKPLEALTRTMRRLATNDLAASVAYTEDKSEIGLIANSIQTFKENGLKIEAMKAEKTKKDEENAAERKKFLTELAGQFETSVGNIVHAVASASVELQTSAMKLSEASRRTNRQASTVASAGEEASVSVQVVASAAEELTSSIHEISRQVTEATHMISGAVEQISRTNQTVKGLADSSSRIGDVVKMINEIAGQTNLLALNATIEAARAGDAGKGFAVVASEVKNLASQTAKATEEITASIASMQGETSSAVDAIQAIGKVVEQINEASQGIASAVTQQNAATREIAVNVQHVSSSISGVSGGIADVTKVSDESLSSTEEVLHASDELSEQSKILKKEVDQFLGQLRVS